MSSVATPSAGSRKVFRVGWCAIVSLLLVGLASGCSTYSTAPSTPAPASSLQVVRLNPALVGSAAEALALAHEGDFTLTGVGESMHPVYVPGTVVVVHPTSYFMLRSGDAVVYRSQAGRDVAHVLVERARGGWMAQGLNNSEPDGEIVTAENLVGVIRCAFVPDRSAAGSLAVAADSTKMIALLH